MKYQIYNIRTKEKVGQQYNCKKRANTRAEKLNLEYGAHSYCVCWLYPDGTIG